MRPSADYWQRLAERLDSRLQYLEGELRYMQQRLEKADLAFQRGAEAMRNDAAKLADSCDFVVTTPMEIGRAIRNLPLPSDT